MPAKERRTRPARGARPVRPIHSVRRYLPHLPYLRASFLRASFLSLTCLVAARLLAPEAEFGAYALAVGPGAGSGLAWSAGPDRRLAARVAASSLLSLWCLWLYFYAAGGGPFWTEALAVTFFALLVLPLAAGVYIFTRDPTRDRGADDDGAAS